MEGKRYNLRTAVPHRTRATNSSLQQVGQPPSRKTKGRAAGSGRALTRRSVRSTPGAEATAVPQLTSSNGAKRTPPVASPLPDHAYDTDSTIIAPASPAEQPMSDIGEQDYICIPWKYIKASSSDSESEGN